MNLRIDVPEARLARFCREHGIRRLEVFGSALRDDFHDDSDVDVLVEFEPGRTPGLAFFDLEAGLEEIFGRPVDLLTRRSVERDPNYLFRREALREVATLYKGRDDRLLLDMLLSARIASGYVAGVDRERFESDGLLQDAVTRRLEILGEAAARISAETRAAHPAIPWSAIVGMRNRLIHEYFRVDLDIVWNVARMEMDPLIAILEPLVPPEDA